MSKQEDDRRVLEDIVATLQGDSPFEEALLNILIPTGLVAFGPERADGDPDSPPPKERDWSWGLPSSLWFRAFGKTAFGNQFPSPLFIAAEEEEE